MDREVFLSETVSGDWVITIPHADDADVETEIAFFSLSATVPDTRARAVVERIAARAAIDLAGKGGNIRVKAPNNATKLYICEALMKAGASVFVIETGVAA